MRLIDADALIDTLDCSDRDLWTKWTIDDAPTIDAVPVVRCKDCEFSHMDGWFCGGAGMMPEHTTLPESFCDHGKRKGGADK